MSARRVLLATRNAGKLREMRRVTRDLDIEWVSTADFPDVPEPLEDGETFLENATKKALAYAEATGLAALADDSGIEVDALDGAPGVHSAYFAGLPRDDAANNLELVRRLREVPADRRTARYRCVMVFVDEGAVLHSTTGTLEGRIVTEPRGEGGFGYDPHFELLDRLQTTAELSADEKHAISHRGQALEAMHRWLRAHWPG